MQPVHPKGNQSWIFIGRTDAEAETPILRPPDAKSWLTGKDPDAGKDWRQEEKGMTADEMVGWHHRLNGHEFEQAPGDSEGQGRLVCCSPWVAKNRTQLSDWTATKPSLLYRISIRHRLLLYGWCHPTISPSVATFSPVFNLSQHQGLFQWVGSLHQAAKVLELQLQHQSFQWIIRFYFL